jgi:hypothetical protein
VVNLGDRIRERRTVLRLTHVELAAWSPSHAPPHRVRHERRVADPARRGLESALGWSAGAIDGAPRRRRGEPPLDTATAEVCGDDVGLRLPRSVATRLLRSLTDTLLAADDYERPV